MPLPPGAHRLPQTPLPPSLRAPAYGPGDVTPSLDQYQLFALAQPVDAAAVYPGRAGAARHGQWRHRQRRHHAGRQLPGPSTVPAGIAGAQLVLTIAAASSGGSLLRADAQVIWYPPRSAAEYIDPARYHVLSITVTIFGRNPHTVHKVVTSQAFIARLAETLDRLQAEPIGTVVLPGGLRGLPAVLLGIRAAAVPRSWSGPTRRAAAERGSPSTASRSRRWPTTAR